MAQWERCFSLFDPILTPFAKTSFIKSNLAYEIPLKAHKGDPPGVKRVTFKSVPLGKLRWTYEDNKKWSQKPLGKSKGTRLVLKAARENNKGIIVFQAEPKTTADRPSEVKRGKGVRFGFKQIDEKNKKTGPN